MIISSIISVNTECNSKCSSCDFWKKNSQHEILSLDEIKRFVLSGIPNGLNQVMISGGEPLLHPQIEEILNFLSNKKLMIMLNTNGLLINKISHEVLEKVDHLVISLDSSKRENYYKIRGVDAFNKIINDIKYLKKKFPLLVITLRVTIMRGNLTEVFEIEKLAKQLDCRIGLNPVDAFSNNFNRIESIRYDLIPTEEEINKFLDILETEDIFTKNRPIDATWTKDKFIRLVNYFDRLSSNRLSETLNEACIVPWSTILLEANGDMKRCFYSHEIGNIKRMTDNEISNLFKLAEVNKDVKILEEVQKCVDCRTKLFC